ncbi:hypothetical protein PMIT1313_02406 [Prochlorococcus marinus str. MIT 1313]|nr:hypothetical protein PMIT1313_02406 [Prochlorococcus marinus str. MIT 1313]KZR70980.1 hypothetical protein PMIT1318_02122 [Prochlorococcus marinus str. MIT 1318]
MQLGSRCYQLTQGQILVSGKQDGSTRSDRLSVRGTTYVLEVSDDGATEVFVLECEAQYFDIEPPAQVDQTPRRDQAKAKPLRDKIVIDQLISLRCTMA